MVRDGPRVRPIRRSFEEARDRDPAYVLAYAGLAMACARMRLYFAKEEEVGTWDRQAHQAGV